ncbi:MAG: hypothetical protein AB8F65_08820 [Woeseiaceae bacterium]
MHTENWLNVETLPRFRDPMTALLYGSRIYLVHATSGEPVPPMFNLLFSQVLSADTQAAMIEALDFLVFHSTESLNIHSLDCTCVSVHERALADAIRAIQAGSLIGYQTAMEQVLLPEDAMSIGPIVQVIASELMQVERSGFVQSVNVTAPKSFAQKPLSVALH